MCDITSSVERYREAARHLWNATFRIGSSDWDTSDRFNRVAVALFESLVLEPHGLVAAERSVPPDFDPPHFTRIAVRAALPRVPIMVNREAPESGYWDDPLTTLVQGTMELRLVDLFDWDELAARDFQYVRAHIVECDAQPHLVNRNALLEFGHVTFHALNAGPDLSGPDIDVS